MAEANTEEQAKIALAQQLASQAQTIYATRDSLQLTSILLAVESMKLSPSSEASQLLQDNLLATPIRTINNDDYVSSVAFSPNGKYVASGGCDKKADYIASYFDEDED